MMANEFVEIKIKITKYSEGYEYTETILKKSKKLSESFKKEIYDSYDIDIDNLIESKKTDNGED